MEKALQQGVGSVSSSISSSEESKEARGGAADVWDSCQEAAFGAAIVSRVAEAEKKCLQLDQRLESGGIDHATAQHRRAAAAAAKERREPRRQTRTGRRPSAVAPRPACRRRHRYGAAPAALRLRCSAGGAAAPAGGEVDVARATLLLDADGRLARHE